MAQGFSLNEYIKNSKDIKKLKIDEAKELCDEYLKEVNPDKKKRIKDNLLLGIQHAIHKNLHWNNIKEIFGATLDFEDLLSMANIYIIELIDTGNLLNYNEYSKIFDTKFYTYLKSNIKREPKEVRRTNLTNDDVLSILVELLKIDETREVTKEDYIEVTKKYVDKDLFYEYNVGADYQDIMDTLKLLSGTEISKTKLRNILGLVMDVATEDHRVSNFTLVDDTTNEVINDLWYEQATKQMLDVISEEELEIIKMFYNMSDKKLKDVIEKEGKSFNELKKIYLRAICKLREKEGLAKEIGVRSK